MKNTSRFLVAAAALALFASAGQTKAQSQLSSDDGIAASPKVRQMLEERKARAMVAPQIVVQQTAPQDNVAASPKVQQLRNEQMARAYSQPASVETAVYKPTGSDGITASPKLRSLLNERQQTIEIAPLK